MNRRQKRIVTVTDTEERGEITKRKKKLITSFDDACNTASEIQIQTKQNKNCIIHNKCMK